MACGSPVGRRGRTRPARPHPRLQAIGYDLAGCNPWKDAPGPPASTAPGHRLRPRGLQPVEGHARPARIHGRPPVSVIWAWSRRPPATGHRPPAYWNGHGSRRHHCRPPMPAGHRDRSTGGDRAEDGYHDRPPMPAEHRPMPRDYVTKILKARVYDVARETPLELAPKLSARLGGEVWLKREDLQPVFSFKLRGAYNKLASLTAEERSRGVVASSAGNHAQGVALAARRLGARALIVMPETAPAHQGGGGGTARSGGGARRRILRRRAGAGRGAGRRARNGAHPPPSTTSTSSPARAPWRWRSCASTGTPSTRSSSRSAGAGSSPGSPPTSRRCGRARRSSASSPTTRRPSTPRWRPGSGSPWRASEPSPTGWR